MTRYVGTFLVGLAVVLAGILRLSACPDAWIPGAILLAFGNVAMMVATYGIGIETGRDG